MSKLAEAVDIAVAQAMRSTYRFRHGCVIVSGKNLISAGHNHVRANTGLTSVHAEIDALWKIHDSNAVDNKKAIVVRVGDTGSLKNSRPCEGCMRALKRHNVKTVVYSTFDGNLEMELL